GDNPFQGNPFGDNPFKDKLSKDNPFKDKGNPFKDNPFKDNPFKDNPFKDAPIPDGSRPQKTLTLADHLNNLKSGDDRAKSDAVSFFRNMDRNIPERAEIAKALEAYAQSKNGRSDIARVLCTWATQDQGATLVTYVQDTDFGNGDRRQAAMAALAEI